MHLRIHDDRPDIPEKEIFLKLFKSNIPGRVILRVVDSAGRPVERGNLLSIDNTGTIRLHIAVSKSFGFDLSASQQLKVES